MLEYFNRTSALRQGTSQLFLSYKKPNKPVSADTVSNWLKNALSKSGISTSLFSAHSTRSASTSCAKAAQIPLDTIMRSARWSNYDTFQKFYNLPVVSQNNFFEILYPLRSCNLCVRQQYNLFQVLSTDCLLFSYVWCLVTQALKSHMTPK